MTQAAGARPSVRRLAGPLGVVAAGLAALAVTTVVDPFTVGLPLCPVHALTGLWCPGCGGTRMVWALAHGDLLLALRSNIAVMAGLPLFAVAWAAWLRTALVPGARIGPRLQRTLFVFLVVLLVFGVARNIPPLDLYLAPVAR